MKKNMGKKQTKNNKETRPATPIRTEEEAITLILEEAKKLAHGKVTGIGLLVDLALELEKLEEEHNQVNANQG